MNSLDTRFSKNVFEAVQKTRSTCFIGSKTTRLRLVALLKHSCVRRGYYIRSKIVRFSLLDHCAEVNPVSNPCAKPQ